MPSIYIAVEPIDGARVSSCTRLETLDSMADMEAYRMDMDGVIAVLVLASKTSLRAGQRP